MTEYVLPENRVRIEARWRTFHANHPEVYDELVRLARELRQRGYKRFGIATIYEVCRWRGMLATDARPRLNNNYRAYAPEGKDG